MVKTQKKAPTPRQVSTAKGIAKRRRVPLPDSILEDGVACKQYIDFYQQTLPPTEDQLELLAELEDKTEIITPYDVAERGYLTFLMCCSMEHIVSLIENPCFIFEGAPDEQVPTKPMLRYAEVLAEEQGLIVPARVTREKDACHAFISFCKVHQPPTNKMIESVHHYLKILHLESRDLILRSKDATRLWLAILRRLHEFRQGVGSEPPKRKY